MATGRDIIDSVLYQLADVTDASFDEDHILDWINRGATEFCSVTGCKQNIETVDTDASAFYFLLSTNLTNESIIINAVEFNQVPLTKSYRHRSPVSGT